MSQNSVTQRGNTGKHGVVGDVDRDGGEAGDGNGKEERGVPFRGPDHLELPKSGRANQHPGSNNWRGVIQGLEGVAVDFFPERIEKDLRHRCCNHRNTGKHGSGKVEGNVRHGSNSDTSGDQEKGKEDARGNCFAKHEVFERDRDWDRAQLRQLVKAYRVVGQIQIHENNRGKRGLFGKRG